MNELKIITNRNIMGISVDILGGDREVWMTRRQIGECLGYRNPQSAIDSIHSKHKERLDKWSVTIKLKATDGKFYDTVVYSAKGVYEICRWSHQAEANEFYDKVYDVLENIRINGFYSAIPPEQLAKIVLDGVNDEWKLENVIIPALRDGKVEQSMLVAKYMGLTADEFGNNPKILKKSNDNRIAKNLIDGWKKRKQGVYSEEDIPAPYKGTPFLWNTIHKMSRSANCYGMFARYCGVDYFNIDGLSCIADHYVKNKIISESDAQSWIDRVLNHDNS